MDVPVIGLNEMRRNDVGIKWSETNGWRSGSFTMTGLAWSSIAHAPRVPPLSILTVGG